MSMTSFSWLFGLTKEIDVGMIKNRTHSVPVKFKRMKEQALYLREKECTGGTYAESIFIDRR